VISYQLSVISFSVFQLSVF